MLGDSKMKYLLIFVLSNFTMSANNLILKIYSSNMHGVW